MKKSRNPSFDLICSVIFKSTQKQPPEMLKKKIFLKISQNSQFGRPYSFIKKGTLAQMFSSEFCEIFKGIFFAEHLWTTASVNTKIWLQFRSKRRLKKKPHTVLFLRTFSKVSKFSLMVLKSKKNRLRLRTPEWESDRMKIIPRKSNLIYKICWYFKTKICCENLKHWFY